ncbi:hypothetical protein CDD81_3518 [Ophiocordyceps australis]|uniref:Zn(2)-C6 fungal-type domain-containing protein n=1 Tax=Ophiocordyceps australis TaxID=1399860 RepID=A0A2C5XXB6_9HYPO|nr:hypothetical protein CDD81_3518 [Ophiocordyceps australis]
MVACEECYRRKTRCDGAQPRCGSCARRGVRCVTSNHRLIRQRRLQDLERRLQSLEKTGPSALHGSGDLEQSLVSRRESSGKQDAELSQQSPIAPTTASSAAESETRPSRGRYLGASIGVGFVDMVEQAVLGSAEATTPEPTPTFEHVSDAYRKPLASSPVVPSSSQLRIPSKEVALRLVAAYFAHWHVTFPLLFRPSFQELVDQIYARSDSYREDASRAFVFDAVLALGSAACNRFEWSPKDTEAHFTRAMSRLETILEYRDLRSMQAYLLCCQYGIHASMRDTGEEMWELLGKAGRLCMELDLHQAMPRSVRGDVHLTGEIPVAIRQEMRVRCFWCYYSLERIVSVTLGRPLVPSDDDIATRLPLTQDDEQLQKPQESQQRPLLSPFVQHIQIRRILSKAHRFLNTSASSRSLPLAEKQVIRRGLLGELEAWKNQIPQLGLERVEWWSSLSSFTSKSWYEAIYHNTVLFLYRPSPTFPYGSLERPLDDEDGLRAMWESSRAAIAKYKVVLQARRLNYSWICLYTIFMAGLANLYSIARLAQRCSSDTTSFLPPFIEAINDIRDCSNIMIAICERWDDVRSSCQVYSRLSNSAVAELYKVHMQYARKAAGSSKTGPDANGEQREASCRDQDDAPWPQQMALFDAADIVDMTGQVGNIDDFQVLFQDMRANIYSEGNNDANEVTMGFGREWFEEVG